MTSVVLWNAMWSQGSPATSVVDEVVKSPGPSGGVQFAAWILPLLLLAGVVLLVVRGLRRVRSAR